MKLKCLFMLLLTVTSHAQDWANKAKYKAENERLATVKSSNRIVLMGDSITEFWKQRDPSFFADNPDLVNRGIGGQTTTQMVERFAADVIALKPKVVVILAGTNDIAGNTGPISIDNIMANIKKMTEMARARKIKVVLCTLLPAAAYPWNLAVNPADKIIALNKKIVAYAKQHHIAYADYYPVTVDSNKSLRREFSGDGVHPNKKGYKAMEPILEAAIKKTVQ